MAERPELGSRKAAVLRAVVEEYVHTGEPVGSETIAGKTGLGVSAATIRNDLASLEERGYLSHPHTSAGRVPTDAGYRQYVDSLPVSARLREAQRRAITRFFAETMLDLEEVLRGTTQLLSRMTQYAGLAVPPGMSEETVLRVELIEVGPALMILVVGQHGRVDKQLVDRPEGLDAEAMSAMERRLADGFHWVKLAEAQATALRLAGEAPDPDRHLLLALADTFGTMREPARPGHVLIGGVGNLTDETAHWRRETLRRLFEALEQESDLVHLLRDVSPTEDVSVTIGAEHPATGEWEGSLVAAPFHAGEMPVGAIGVVGPTAMDYLSVMASVRAVARRLSELATQLGG